ncbi:MAG TPA: MFS transporter, partial [Steroidobacteraceae bacterium]|nr:MFS transporter [Steroidobacteraceae bacterium]
MKVRTESVESPTFQATVRESLHVLGTRRFGVFWGANFLSNIGTWAQMVAQPWLLLSLGASSFLLGLDAFALSGPVLLLTLFGGVLADRADRRRVIGVFQTVQMLCPTLIVLLLWWGTVRPWEIILLSLVIGVTDALSMPAFQTIVPSIVKPSEVPAAMALNSAQFNLCRILGPALAGLVMAAAGALGAFAISAASYLPVIFIAVTLLPSGAAFPRDAFPTDYRQLFSGVRETMRDATLRGAVLTVFSSSALCGPLMTFCPVLVRDAFRGDVANFSISVAAFGVGGVLGAAGLLGVRASRDRRQLTSFAGVLYGLVVVAAA